MPEAARVAMRIVDPVRVPRSAQHGRLILVTCVDMGRLDLVLGAALRRLAVERIVVLAEPVGTAALPAGSGVRVGRGAFGALDAAGGLVLGWQENGRSFGYRSEMMQQLAGGANVVVPARAGCGVEAAARALWGNVVVVKLEPGTQRLRAALSARDCDVRICDLGDVAMAVRGLSEALAALLPMQAARAQRAAQSAGAGRQTPAVAHAAKAGCELPRLRPLPTARRAMKPQARAVSPT